METPEFALQTLNSKVYQLEEQQAFLKRCVIALKQKLDTLTQNFENRPETSQLEKLQTEITAIQLQLNCISPLTNSFLDNQNDQIASEQPLDDQEVVKQFFERVDNQLAQESNLFIPVNSQPELDFSSVNDAEFLAERVLFLVGFYCDLQAGYKTSMSAEELLEKDKAGEKDFRGIDLQGIELNKQSFTSRVCDFTQANFANSIFNNCNLWYNYARWHSA